MLNFYSTVNMYTHMVLLTNKTLINIAYLGSYTPFKVKLKDGTSLKSTPFAVSLIKAALTMLLAEESPTK